MADDDKAHRDRLRKENTRRLRVLELRQARQGDGVDPAVLAEMDEIRSTLATLDMAEAPSPSPEAAAHLRSRFVNEFDFWIAQLASLTTRQSKTEERLTAVEVKQEEATEWRAAERTERQYGQRRNFRISMATLLLLVAIAAVAATYLVIGG